MSTTSMVETYDTPMIDFNEDSDIPMAHSTTENWYQQALSGMDEDGHIQDGSFHQPHSLEVDMITYEETAEYEMADEADGARHTHTTLELPDAEVYDASVLPSPAPLVQSIVETSHPSHHDDVSVVPSSHSFDNGGSAFADEVLSPGLDSVQVPLEGKYESENSVVAHDVPGQITDTLPEQIYPDTSLGQDPTLVDSALTDEESPATAKVTASTSNADGDTNASNVVQDGEPSGARVRLEREPDHHNESEQSSRNATEAPQESGAAEFSVTNQQEHEIAVQETSAVPHDEAGQVYYDPPPPVLLSLQTSATDGDQPDFVLFTVPEGAPSAEESGEAGGQAEEPLLLLQHRPNLFYEPVSSVFEALRQEEYFSHLEDLIGGELALNAYDMQLAISEDNVYAREVSLHDLNAMHGGVGLTGLLRLSLQSVFPRFINRYNTLRDQIARLVLLDGASNDANRLQDVHLDSQTGATEGTEQGNPTLSPEYSQATPHLLGVHDSSAGAADIAATTEAAVISEEDNQTTEPSKAVEAIVDTNRINVEVEGEQHASDEQHNPDEAAAVKHAQSKVTVVAGTTGSEQAVALAVDGQGDAEDADADGEDDPDAEGELDEDGAEYDVADLDGIEGANNDTSVQPDGEIVPSAGIASASSGDSVADEFDGDDDDAAEFYQEDDVDDQQDSSESSSHANRPDKAAVGEAQASAVPLVESSSGNTAEDVFDEGYDGGEYADEHEEVQDATEPNRTDHSSTTQPVHDGEGKQESEQLDSSEFSDEETLEDSPEDLAADLESASQAALLDEGDFLEEFDEEETGDINDRIEEAGAPAESHSKRAEEHQESDAAVTTASDLVHVSKRNTSKRSLDDTEFDAEAELSALPGSPDSKRARVQ